MDKPVGLWTDPIPTDAPVRMVADIDPGCGYFVGSHYEVFIDGSWYYLP